ncbi:MAG: 1-deoxy-D-xylulose-5-phosphate reductoisomerase, partial [Rubrivivax sp.]|nr:1-deoxy-D-xylulose-5-phosphate reductoisomerase [Rubrivivax sp.]
MNRQRLLILGSTGSVGTSTLDVVARHPVRFEVVGLTSFRRVDLLFEQCRSFKPRVAVLPTEQRAAELRGLLAGAGLDTEVRVGAQALVELAGAAEVDSVMASIVGAAGLPACLAAARAGKRLLLAN